LADDIGAVTVKQPVKMNHRAGEAVGVSLLITQTEQRDALA